MEVKVNGRDLLFYAANELKRNQNDLNVKATEDITAYPVLSKSRFVN